MWNDQLESNQMDVDTDRSDVAVPPLQRPALSVEGKALTQMRQGDAIAWVRFDRFDAMAEELIDLHACSLTLEANLSTLWEGATAKLNGREVTHVGQGVFVQNNTIGIDTDSKKQPRTITTPETREFARKCLQSSLDDLPLVLGTGQPRIGKTRGALAYTLQELLWRGEAVMRVSYKDNIAYLFLPQENGTYQVWKTKAEKWSESLLVDEESMFVLIDPPEDGQYVRSAACHVLEFCSNNEQRHLKNADKDGQVLIMGVPSLDEVLCMRSVLWDTKEFPVLSVNEKTKEVVFQQHFVSCESGEFFEELVRRCSLIGCIPGIVFSGSKFIKKLREVKTNAKKECVGMGLPNLINSYKGGAIGTDKSAISSMSRFFIVNPLETNRADAIIHLNAAASFYIRKELKEKLASVTGSAAFEFEDVCAVLLKGGSWGGVDYPKRDEIVCGADLRHTTTLILNLTGNVLVRASNCYPILDFAVAPDVWFNAKVGESTPKVSLSAYVTLMHYLDFASIQNNSLVLKEGTPKITLTMIRNRGSQNVAYDRNLPKTYEKMDAGQIQKVFEENVVVKFLDTTRWSLEAAFDARMSIVQEMLNEYARPLSMNGT